jgi:hypothetical protein
MQQSNIPVFTTPAILCNTYKAMFHSKARNVHTKFGIFAFPHPETHIELFFLTEL